MTFQYSLITSVNAGKESFPFLSNCIHYAKVEPDDDDDVGVSQFWLIDRKLQHKIHQRSATYIEMT